MKNILSYIILIFLLATTACQKGIHWVFESEGLLLKDSAGNCIPVEIGGNYIVNKSTDDSNFLMVNVNVTAAGNYSITTDSVNGFVFKASGVFSNNGYATVKLNCIGTPLQSGISHFNIRYNNSVCEAYVNVLSDTVPASSYTLQGSSGICMNDTIQGSYLQTVALDTSNKVIISVNVSVPGKYSISTNTVNGYSFSGDGVFTATGIQSIIIQGKGTPMNVGNNVFAVNANNSTCSFSVNVIAVVQVTNQLHFPLTQGSYWTYINSVFNNTTRRYINGDSLIDDESFVKMSETITYTTQNYFFNLSADNYNEFGKVEKYNTSFGYAPPIYGLIPFLKEGLGTGVSWESETFKGPTGDGEIIYFKYDYYCLASSGIKVVNGFGFKDVYVIAVYPQLKSDLGGWGTTNEVYHNYYAKGVGLICVEESGNGNPFQPVLQIVDWKVN